MPRECGPCDACCTIPPIAELGKAAYEPCRNLVAIGNPPQPGRCGIYAERPRTCLRFRCLWLAGLVGGDIEKHRPDALGLMFTATPEVVHAYETRPGSALDPHGAYFLKKVAEVNVVIVVPHPNAADQQRRFLGPRHAVQAYIRTTLARSQT